MLDTIIGTIKKLTEAGMALIALAIVVQVIFGTGAAGVPLQVLLLAQVLGLAAVAVIYALFTRNQNT